jgi:hypothetical protein
VRDADFRKERRGGGKGSREQCPSNPGHERYGTRSRARAASKLKE